MEITHDDYVVVRDFHAVSIDLYLEVDTISFYVTNSVDPQVIEAFQHFIQRLLTAWHRYSAII